MQAADLDALVQKLTDEATPELLPRLLKIFLHDDRPGLVTCERHMVRLFPYVRAQILLTRAKRNYYRDDSWAYLHRCATSSKEPSEVVYIRALNARDEARKIYRSTPCTCWVQKR